MKHVSISSNVIDFEAARVRAHARTVATREAKNNRLDREATREALAWAEYVSTWVRFCEVERLIVDFCAGVFLPPRDWPSTDSRSRRG